MKKIILITIVSLFFQSCADFLKPVSRAQFIPETTEAIQELLIGNGYPTCDNNKDKNFYYMSVLALLDPDIACTNLDWTSPTLQFPKNEMFGDMVFSYSPELPLAVKVLGQESIYDTWTSTYTYVLGCNATLDYVDGVLGEQEERENIKAQAHALRAFYYLHLMSIYAPPYAKNQDAMGVILKLESDMVNFTRKRNTVKECYDQIIKDLKTAEALYEGLPKGKQFSPDYMTNLPMVQLLLSRTYLYIENWSEAAAYSEKVIKDWNFELIDLNTIPTTGYHNFNTYATSSEGIWFYGQSDAYTLLTTRESVGSGISGINFNRFFFRASDDLLQSYVEGDLRRDKYIIKEKYRENSTSPYIYTAMAKVNVDASNKIQKNTYACAMRLSEAYLNRAEALCMMNRDASEVYSLINELRKNRFKIDKYTDMPTLTGDDLLNYVRNERRLELCLEAGHRFNDVRRWGLGFKKYYQRRGFEQDVVIEPNDLCLTMPVPPSAYELNPQVKQNPKGEVKLTINY